MAQSDRRSRRGELYAQRETRRGAREDFGRLPAPRRADRAAAVAGASGEAETDATIARCVGDIESDVSRPLNLSGRSAAGRSVPRERGA